MSKERLLELDGVGNLLLGIPLVASPQSVAAFLGIPTAADPFYALILGAVFVGIGVALLVERFRPNLAALGIAGAAAINLVFGLVLTGWLLLSDVVLPLRGSLFLWALAVVLVGISGFEAASLVGTRDRRT